MTNREPEDIEIGSRHHAEAIRPWTLNTLNGVVFTTVHPDTLVIRKVNERAFQQQNEATSLVLRRIGTTRIKNIESVKTVNTEDGRCKGRDRTNWIKSQRDVRGFYVRVSSKE